MHLVGDNAGAQDVDGVSHRRIELARFQGAVADGIEDAAKPEAIEEAGHAGRILGVLGNDVWADEAHGLMRANADDLPGIAGWKKWKALKPATPAMPVISKGRRERSIGLLYGLTPGLVPESPALSAHPDHPLQLAASGAILPVRGPSAMCIMNIGDRHGRPPSMRRVHAGIDARHQGLLRGQHGDCDGARGAGAGREHLV